MSIFGLINDSLEVAGLMGSKKAEDIDKMFVGNCEIVMGTFLQGILGSKDEYYFGPREELIITGRYGGLGPLFGEFMSKGGFTTLLGLSGKSTVVLGRQTHMIYGGPLVELRHGPRVEKSTYLPPEMSDTDQALASLQNLPGFVPTDDVGTLARADAEARSPVIRVLCALLAYTTLALELSIRLAYPKQSKGDNKNTDPFSTPNLLDETLTHVPSILMGILYLYDMTGTALQMASYCLSNAQAQIMKVYNFITVTVPDFLSASLTTVADGIVRLATWLGWGGFLIVVLFVLIVFVAAVALT